MTLEKSGNKVVNAIYSSALEGNHTEKHVGSLASKFFVEGKYKNCDYFLEEAYHEQIKLREKLQAEKQDMEIPVGPSTDDLLKKALKKQGSIKSLTLEDSDDEEEEEIEAKRSLEKQSKKTKEGRMPYRTKNAMKKLSSARDLMKGILKSDKSADSEATPNNSQTIDGKSPTRSIPGEGGDRPTLAKNKPLSPRNLTRQRSTESERRPRMTRKARSSRSLTKDGEGELRPRMTRRTGSSRSLLKDKKNVNEGTERRARLTGRASSTRNLMRASSLRGLQQDDQGKPDKSRRRRVTRSSSARNVLLGAAPPVKADTGRQRRPRNNTLQRSSTAGPKLGLQRSSTAGAINRVSESPDRVPNEIVNAEEFAELSGLASKRRIARTRSGQKSIRSRTPLSERVPRGVRQDSRSASRGSLKRTGTNGSAASMKGSATNGSAGSQHRSVSSLGLHGSFIVEWDKAISIDDNSASLTSLNSIMSKGQDDKNAQLLDDDFSGSGNARQSSLKSANRSQAAEKLQQGQPGEKSKLFQTFQRTMSRDMGDFAQKDPQLAPAGTIALTNSKASKKSNQRGKRVPENGPLEKKSVSLVSLRNTSRTRLARTQSTTSASGSACDNSNASRSRNNRTWESKIVRNDSSKVTAVFKGIVDSGVQIDDPNNSQVAKTTTIEKDYKDQTADSKNGGKQKSGQDLDDLSFSSADFDPDKKTATQDVNEQSEKWVEFEQEIERGCKILPETTEDCSIIQDESRINEVSNAASSRVHVDVPSIPTKEELGYE